MIDEPHEVLRRARVKKGFSTAAEAARAFGWNEVTYVSHENGTRGIRPSVAQKYAKALGIEALSLLELPERGKSIIGLETISVIGETAMRVAFRVADDSVDKAINSGEIAIVHLCEPVDLSTLQVGALVVIERRKGGLTERSVRRIEHRNGPELVLAFYSRNPRFSERINVNADNATDELEIIGRVVGKYAEVTLV